MRGSTGRVRGDERLYGRKEEGKGSRRDSLRRKSSKNESSVKIPSPRMNYDLSPFLPLISSLSFLHVLTVTGTWLRVADATCPAGSDRKKTQCRAPSHIPVLRNDIHLLVVVPVLCCYSSVVPSPPSYPPRSPLLFYSSLRHLCPDVHQCPPSTSFLQLHDTHTHTHTRIFFFHSTDIFLPFFPSFTLFFSSSPLLPSVVSGSPRVPPLVYLTPHLTPHSPRRPFPHLSYSCHLPPFLSPSHFNSDTFILLFLSSFFHLYVSLLS